MRYPRDRSVAEQPFLLILLAMIGVMGCVAVIVGMFLAQAAVQDHYWVSDTISDLAAGEFEIVMDLALFGFATGLLTVSLAAAHAHLGGVGWSAGVLSFAVLSALVVVVGALFTPAPLCMASAVGQHHVWAQRALIGLAVAWAVLCPIFLLSPTSIDGLLERALGLIACALVCTLCAVFFLRGVRCINPGAGRQDRFAN